MIVDDVSSRLLNEPFGILSSFSARLSMCYALGLLPAMQFENLKIIRDVRNKFAHSHKPLDFDHVEIQEMCGKLKLDICVDRYGNVLDPQPQFCKSVRDRFCQAVFSIFSQTLGTAAEIKRQEASWANKVMAGKVITIISP